MNWEARKFLADLGRKISRVSGDDRETTFLFLFQRVSVLLFRYNNNNNNNPIYKAPKALASEALAAGQSWVLTL